MNNQKRNRWVYYGLLAVAAVYIAVFYVIPGLFANSDVEAASSRCIRAHTVDLDHGEHDGQSWRITASVEKIEKNGGHCSFWFLKVNFRPHGVSPGSWTEGWGITAGGHLPRTATIDAHEEEEGQAVGGVVGARISKVVLRLTGGRTMVVYPKEPRDGLLRRYVWLHGLRYFLTFYPAGEHVRAAVLLDATGKVIYTAHNQQGELQGNMVY